MDLSVLIPTRARPDKLGRCLERLARQTLPAERFEVLVGVDGRDDSAADAAHELAARTAGSIRATIHQFDHGGPGATRNRLFAHSRGRIILLLNDDVLPEPELLQAHLCAHAQDHVARRMVLGSAPWVVPADDTLFDRLVRETSMVFFYDRMDAALARGEVGPDHDWGFRHAWTLNLSLHRSSWEAVGGFDERLRFACYEDLEFAFRVRSAIGSPVVYAPGAIVRHDHRILPDDYLRRETMMGRAAWEFAAACPPCALEVFGRDIRTEAELAYSREFRTREASIAERIRGSMLAWASIRSDALPSAEVAAHAAPILRGLYEHHLLLKRWTWRRGLLDAAASAPAAIHAR